jgi:hypothetical protein
VVLKLQVLLEEDWVAAGDTVSRKLEVVKFGFQIVLTFGAGLRGEEMVKADLGRMAELLSESLAHPLVPHVTIALLGRVKGEKQEKCHLLPMALESASGILYGLWIHRLVLCYRALGITQGPVLRTIKKRKTVRARVSDLDPKFHEYLRRVQRRWPRVLPPDVDVAAEMSLRHSGHIGSTSQARNVKMPEQAITLNNRWRKRDRSKGKAVSMSMFDHYSDVRAMAPSLCEYSGSL